MIHPNLSISNFKKFIRLFFLPYLLYFFIFGFVIQTVIEKYIILSNPVSAQSKINKILNITTCEEIPMFGSSRMMDILMPSILGKNYFNYGIIATGDDVNLFFLNEELKKKKSGPILINFDLEGLSCGLGDIRNYLSNANNASIHRLLNNRDRYYFHVILLKYYGFYAEFLADYLSLGNRKFRKPLSDNGALIFYESPKNSLLDDIKKESRHILLFKNDTLLLKKLSFQISSHPHRTFIFVIPPYHPAYFKNFKNEADVLCYFKYLRSFENVKVLDFSRIHFPDSDFIDIKHLNYNGAVKFSNILKDSLLKM